MVFGCRSPKIIPLPQLQDPRGRPPPPLPPPGDESVEISPAANSSITALPFLHLYLYSPPPNTKCPMTNAGAAHLVYVRRKPDPPHLPPASTASSDPQQPPIPALDSSPPGKSIHHQYQSSSENISSPNQVSLGISSSMLTPPDPTKLTTTPATTTIKHWENDPSCKLNSSLDKLDHSDQKDYIEMLRSLSSVELSKHAVELEKRSIQLSLEEAKELQRVQALDVLERYSKHSVVPSNQQNM